MEMKKIMGMDVYIFLSGYFCREVGATLPRDTDKNIINKMYCMAQQSRIILNLKAACVQKNPQRWIGTGIDIQLNFKVLI